MRASFRAATLAIVLLFIVGSGYANHSMALVNGWIDYTNSYSQWRECPRPFFGRDGKLKNPVDHSNNPYFEFNGKSAKLQNPIFSCRQAGHFVHKKAKWFVQDIKNLLAEKKVKIDQNCIDTPSNTCPTRIENIYVDAVRVCNPDYRNAITRDRRDPTKFPIRIAPCNHGVGPKGCEVCRSSERPA